jgi:hypothetical protein
MLVNLDAPAGGERLHAAQVITRSRTGVEAYDLCIIAVSSATSG